MESSPRYPETPIESCRDDYWTSKPTNWPRSATVGRSDQDTSAQWSTEHPTEYFDEENCIKESAMATEARAVRAQSPNQDVQVPPKPLEKMTCPMADHRDGLKEHTRADIELQLATLTEYIRNKKLRPMEWICCSCSKEQKYRDNLEPLDRLRCQYPRCGVSDKGFRIYRVHDMCDQCTVFVDQRVPVTKRSLKKKRDEVRNVLKKMKKVYEDVDRLMDFDDKETEDMASLKEEREAREEFERERQEEDLYRTEMKERQRDDVPDENLANSDSESHYEGDLEQEDWGEGEARQQVKGKPQKMRGLKALLRL